MNVLINDKYLTDIADAIREKVGTTDTYTTNEMASAIRSISTDGMNADDIANEAWMNMTSIHLETATNVDKWVGSTKLTSASGPFIKYADFTNCVNLITFHSDEEEVVGDFTGCSKLYDVGDSAFTATHGTFSNCANLSKVRISSIDKPYGSSMTAIRPFDGCVSLEKVDIQGDILISDQSIANLFGSSCTNMKAIIFRNLSKRIEINWNAVSGGLNKSKAPNLYIYVPTSLYDTYINYADSYITDRIRKIEDYPDICNWEEAE